MRMRILSPAAKLQFDGSLPLVAVDCCQVVCDPVEAVISEPQEVSAEPPCERYIW